MGMMTSIDHAGRRTSADTEKTLRSRLLRLFGARPANRSSRSSRFDLAAMPVSWKRDLGFADEPDLSVGDDLFR